MCVPRVAGLSGYEKRAVPAGGYVNQVVYLVDGQLIEGSYTVLAGKDIYFYVYDPYDSMLQQRELATGGQFGFRAGVAGWYTLQFVSPGVFTNKIVQYEWTAQRVY